jgi:L-alanine-DL-glutamate epimerase-like enolase superfamily enzyme
MNVGVPGDTKHLLAVSREIREIPIRPDSNMGHSKAEAIAQLTELRAEGVTFELVEDPCPTDFDDHQEIGDLLDVPISIDGGWSSFADLSKIICANKSRIGCVNIMTTYWVLYRSVQIVGALEAAGIGWTLGTSHDSSIKISAALHLGTAMPNRIYPCDLLEPRFHVDDVAVEPLEITAGYGTAPEKPGLGVDLNEAVMARWAVGG